MCAARPATTPERSAKRRLSRRRARRRSSTAASTMGARTTALQPQRESNRLQRNPARTSAARGLPPRGRSTRAIAAAVNSEATPAAAERKRTPKTVVPKRSSAPRYNSRYRTPTLPQGLATPYGAGRMASAKSDGAPLSARAGVMSDTSSIQREGGAVSRNVKRAVTPRTTAPAETAKSVTRGSGSGSREEERLRAARRKTAPASPPAHTVAAMTKSPRTSRGRRQAESGAVRARGRTHRMRSTPVTNATATPTRKAARADGSRQDAALTRGRTASPPALLLEEEEEVHGRRAERKEISRAQRPRAVLLGSSREIIRHGDGIAVQIGAARRPHVHQPEMGCRADQPAEELCVQRGVFVVHESLRGGDAKPRDRHADSDELRHLAADQELVEVEAHEPRVVRAEPQQVVTLRESEEGL